MPAATLIADPPLFVRGAERELVQVGLADQHRAGVPKVRNRWRIAFRHVSLAHARRGGRCHAAHVEQVLD
jgi:hypothetical protein